VWVAHEGYSRNIDYPSSNTHPFVANPVCQTYMTTRRKSGLVVFLPICVHFFGVTPPEPKATFTAVKVRITP
jgi:hypothetical protein